MKKDPLGRGLSAILQDMEDRNASRPIAVEQILPNPSQPRLEIGEESLAELAASIKEKGILQPIVVRRREKGYEIIAGERRYRAALLVGLREVPAMVKDVDDREAMELSLIENLQREDLNPLEVAASYRRLMDDFGYTQEEVATRLGKDRSSVANAVRLLKLPDWIRSLLAGGRLSAGHGRALLAMKGEAEQRRFVDRILREGLPVRAVEDAVRGRRQEKRTHLANLEEGLAEALRTRVRVTRSGKKGKIVIEFYSNEDLQRIVDLISGKA